MVALGNWDEVAAFASTLPGTERSTYFGGPAIKVAANGRAFLSAVSEAGSFVLMIDEGSKDMLIETDPDSFWQTAHYDGWPALLVRYASPVPERVATMIERAHQQAAAKKAAKPRQAK